jgi:hypothetical protein
MKLADALRSACKKYHYGYHPLLIDDKKLKNYYESDKIQKA